MFFFKSKEKNEDKMLSELMTKLGEGKVSKSEFLSKADMLDLDVTNRPVVAAIINLLDPLPEQKEENTKLVMQAGLELIDTEEGIVFKNKKNMVCIMFFSDVLWEEQIRKIMEEINKMINKRVVGTKKIITVGNLVDNCMEYSSSYKCAIGLQDYSKVKKEGKILYYSDIVKRRKTYPQEVNFSFNLLQEYLTAGSFEKLENYIENIYMALEREYDSKPGLMYNITFELAINAISILKECNDDVCTLVEEENDLMNKVLSSENMFDLKEWLLEFMKHCKNAVEME